MGDSMLKRSHSPSVDSASAKAKVAKEDAFVKYCGFYSYRKGEREDMQDAHVLINDFKPTLQHVPDGIERMSYYAIFDGHGGRRAATYAANNLHKNIAGRFPKGDLPTAEKELKRCFLEAYKRTDDAFLSEATKVYVVCPNHDLNSNTAPRKGVKPVWKDGSTATSLLAINNVIYMANLGDSKAILCRFKPDDNKEIGVTLTRDHNPTIFEERIRIEKAGGHVKDGRVLGQLEVSRAFGDGPYKNHGISAVPDIKRCTLTRNDRYIIIACDGLWKAFTVAEVITFVGDVLKEKSFTARDDKSVEEVKWEAVCSRLAAEAVRRKSGDNVTVVAVALKWESSNDSCGDVK